MRSGPSCPLALTTASKAGKNALSTRENCEARASPQAVRVRRRLAGCADALFAQARQHGQPSFLILMGMAGIAYLLAIRELFSTPKFPRRVIYIALALSVLWHVPFLLTPPGLDDDIHRYLWDGRVQRLGYNPYVVVPSDPAVTGLHTPETRTLNNPDLPSPYPLGAELFFRAVTAIHESIFTLKVAFVVRFCHRFVVGSLSCAIAGRGCTGRWLMPEPSASDRSGGQRSHLYRRSVAAAGRLSPRLEGGGVRLKPCLGWQSRSISSDRAPALYWKRVRIRDGALAAIEADFYHPFFYHGRTPIGSLGVFVERSALTIWYLQPQPVAVPQFVAVLAVLRPGFLLHSGCAARPRYFFGRFCMADRRSTPLFTSYLSVVPSLGAAVPAIGIDRADHHLDSQHHSNLLRLAFAHARPSVAGSRLDSAPGIRMRRDRRCSHYAAPNHSIGCATDSTD